MLNLEQKENGTPIDKIITLRGIFKTKHTVQPAFDPKVGWYRGVKRITEDDKKSLTYYVTVGETGENARKNTSIVLEDGIEFNLDNEVDAINWAWVKETKEVASSFEEAQKSKTARFYVEIEGKEALKKNIEVEKKFEAIKYVLEDSPVNYENRALLLGFDMKGENPEVVKQFLLEQANNSKTCKKVIEVYESKFLGIHLLYLKAKQKNVITTTPNGAIKFGSQVFGMSDEAAISFLQNKDNKEVLALLEKETNPDYFVKDNDPANDKEEGTEQGAAFDFTK